MRMYVTLVLAALLVIGVSSLAAYFVKARQKARKRQALAARLEAVVAQAEREHANRKAAANASAALTTVLPAIQPEERSPRRVA
jgi:Tfp pilus assembly protein PilE